MSFENEEDVLSESSPEQQQEQQNNEPAEAQASEPQEQKQGEESVPFHLHPRFQEVISEKNALKEQVSNLQREYQRQMQDLQKQLESSRPKEAQKDALMERLKSIDPEFADRFGKVNKVEALEQELQEFRQWKNELAAERVRSEANSTKDRFYTENSIPQERRRLYDAQLLMAAQANPNLGISDLPKLLKGIHDEMGKLFSTVERTATKQLVEGKKAEASRPSSQPKGKPANGSKQEKASDPAAAKAQVIKDILAEVRASEDI